MMVVIDNYDSFTYNLVHMLETMGCEAMVYRNDEITVKQIERLHPKGIVISPGPGRPEGAGITLQTIELLAPELPILGVCLGHQAIAIAFGGTVARASRIMHGKTSEVSHDGEGIFEGLSNPFEATRYHSLIVEKTSLPHELVITAWTDHGEIMGLRHVCYPTYGVQFHPESILTKEGYRIVENFIRQDRL